MAGPRVLSVVGNRPQLVKAAPVHAALAARAALVAVDTGQHYDDELSGVFYRELGIPEPAHRLGVGSGSHAVMTARILERIEPVLVDERPDVVVVYGDTNSTLAAALAAAKLHRPVAHVEAGLRSFDRSMPEEVNRVLVDHASALLLAPTPGAVANLRREGIGEGVVEVGDVMVDAARLAGPLVDALGEPWRAHGVEPGAFVLATVHREANTRSAALARIVEGLAALELPVLLPLHPRTRAALDRDGLTPGGAIRVLPPLGYLAFTALLRAARVLVTDSGGAQKEAYLHGVPCVTLRDRTEWTETVEVGWNRLVGTDPRSLRDAVADAERPSGHPDLYGDGRAAERAADEIVALAERSRTPGGPGAAAPSLA